MSVHGPSPGLDDQAAAWATRIDAGELDAADSADLSAWLAGDRRREGALLRAQAALSFLDRGRALSGVVPAPQRLQLWSRRRIMVAAASLAGVSVAGLGTLRLLAPATRRYATELGELRRVPLDDGSVAAINTQSVVEVVMEPKLRQIRLARGEAWFQVAKDASRPFLVEAGPVRIQAVGTAFSVRRREQGADVLVTEGTVQTWVVGAEDRKASVTMGSQAYLPDVGPPRLSENAREIAKALAWRDGQIALEGETLEQAVENFNRYNRRKIIIMDADLAHEKLVGQFRTGEPAAFARAVRATLGAVVSEDTDGIRLSRPAVR